MGRQPICVVLNEASRFDSGGNVNKIRPFSPSPPCERLIKYLPGIYIRILFVVYARILRQNSEGGYIQGYSLLCITFMLAMIDGCWYTNGIPKAVIKQALPTSKNILLTCADCQLIIYLVVHVQTSMLGRQSRFVKKQFI